MRLGRDIGSVVLAVNAIASAVIVAGGAGDNTEINGASIDRQALGNLYESVQLAVLADADMADTETLSLAVNLQHSDDGSAWTDFGDALASAVVSTASEAVTNQLTTTKLDVDIRGAKRYLRAQVTPDLSAANTDTANISAAIVFGGGQEYPAT